MQRKHPIINGIVLLALVVATFIGGYFFNLGGITGYSINQNQENIVGGDIIEENISFEELSFEEENLLIGKDVAQLTLDSSDVEAGYTLRRPLSGYRKIGNVDYFVKRFDKGTFLTSVKEQRVLYVKTYKFQNKEEADKKFGELIRSVVNTNLYDPIADIEPIGEASLFLKRDYLHNFYSFEEYSTLILVKNVIYQIRLHGYSDSVTEGEVEYYAKRLIEKLEETPKTTLEIPQTQKANPEEDLRVSLKINNASSGKSSSWRTEEEIVPAWDYNFLDDKFTIFYDSEARVWIHSFLPYGNPKNKRFLILSTCINNGYMEDISINPKHFLLKDNKGNIYTSFAKKEGSEILKKGKITCSEYAYPIFKENKAPEIKNFDVILLDSDKQVILGKAQINLEDFGTYYWNKK